MAVLSNSLRLNDQMSPVLSKIVSATEKTLKAMKGIDAAAGRGLSGKNMQGAERAIGAARNELTRLRNNLAQVPPETEKVRRGFSGWQTAIITANQALELIKKGVRGFKAFADVADDMTNISARMALIAREGESVAEMQEGVFRAAQRSRGEFTTFSDSVAKFGQMAGHAFKSTDEIIAFTELINKAIVTAGTAGAGADAAIFQLTQGLASGTLRGEELNSVLEQATPIAQAIAKYMGLSDVGGLRDLAKDGLITAEVVKNAMFAAADDIDAKFAQMPMTFGQSMTMLKNVAMQELQPIIGMFSQLVNSPAFANMISTIARGVTWAVSAIMTVINWIGTAISWIQANGEAIQQVLTTVGSVLSAVLIPLIVQATAMWLQKGAVAVASAIKTAAAWAIANWQLVAVMAIIGIMIAFWDQLGVVGQAVCFAIAAGLLLVKLAMMGVSLPILLIIGLVLLIAGAFLIFGDTATQVLGWIVGGLAVVGAVIANVFLGAIKFVIGLFAALWNTVVTVAEFLANVFNDPIGAIVRLFAGMADSVLSILESIAKAIDTIFGSNLAGAVSGWRSGLGSAVTSLVGEAKVKLDRMDTSSIDEALGRIDYGDAWDSGNTLGKNIGKGLQGGIESIKSGVGSLLGGGSNIGMAGDASAPYMPGLGGAGGVGTANVPTGASGGAGAPGSSKSNPSHVKQVEDISISQEDLRYMRDIAKYEFVNKYTSLSPTLNATFGDIRETADVRQVMDAMVGMVRDAKAAALL